MLIYPISLFALEMKDLPNMKDNFRCFVFNTVKWGDIEQFSMFFLYKIDYHNYMGPILQT